MQELSRPNCSDELSRAFILIVIVYDKHGVNHGRNPKQETQEEIDECLYRFAAKEHGNRGKKKGK